MKTVGALKDLCICLIAQNFEKFYDALSASNNTVIQENMLLLQKEFSYELVEQIFKRKLMKEKYLGFIINEHLKVLNPEWFRCHFFLSSLEDNLQRLPNLTTVRLGIDIDDEILRNIAIYCPKVTEINSFFSCITDIGVKYLCKNENGNIPCSNLKNFNLYGTKVTVEGVKCLLQDVPSLECIVHNDLALALYALHKDDLPEVENVNKYNLTCLRMLDMGLKRSTVSDYNGLLKICLTLCPRLKSFSCIITDSNQFTFLKNHDLEEIEIIGLDSYISMDNFFKLNWRNLHSIELSDCSLSLPDLAISCPKLRCFYIRHGIFSNNDNDSQPMFNCLKSCYFDNVSEPSLSKATCLLSSPKLQKITFNLFELSLAMKTAILKAAERNPLEEIYFYFGKIDINFIEDILISCPTLKSLGFHECGLHHLKDQLTKFAEGLQNKPLIISLQC